MRDMQQVTAYFRAAYTIAAVIYGSYVVSLVVRARRARARLDGSQRRS